MRNNSDSYSNSVLPVLNFMENNEQQIAAKEAQMISYSDVVLGQLRRDQRRNNIEAFQKPATKAKKIELTENESNMC